MPRVLVTDAAERAALAVIRSLGMKGIEVIAADSTSFNAGFLSKYCSRRIIYPPPLNDKGKFVNSILHFVKNENLDLLIPVTDLSMMPILECRDEIEDYVKIAAPPYDIMIKAFDKAQTIKIAEKNGIPCPKTFLVESLGDVEKAAKVLKYPVVIKPRMKVVWVDERAITLKVTSRNYAYNKEDLITKYKQLTAQLKGVSVLNDFFLVQEFVEGEGYGVEVLMHNLEPRAMFVHKRLREYPITGGASTLRVSVRNEKMRDLAIALLKAMGWEGVAMVEFKLDENSGEVRVLEVNGRFWGSLPLAISAGVDFPYLLYKVMVGENAPVCFDYRVGVTQRWLIPGDLLWLFSSLHNNRKSKLRSFMEFFNSLSVPDDIISFSDPSPSIGALAETLHCFLDFVKGNRTIYGEVRLSAA